MLVDCMILLYVMMGFRLVSIYSSYYIVLYKIPSCYSLMQLLAAYRLLFSVHLCYLFYGYPLVIFHGTYVHYCWWVSNCGSMFSEGFSVLLCLLDVWFAPMFSLVNMVVHVFVLL